MCHGETCHILDLSFGRCIVVTSIASVLVQVSGSLLIFGSFSCCLCGLPSAEQRVTSEVGARELSQEGVAMGGQVCVVGTRGRTRKTLTATTTALAEELETVDEEPP